MPFRAEKLNEPLPSSSSSSSSSSPHKKENTHNDDDIVYDWIYAQNPNSSSHSIPSHGMDSSLQSPPDTPFAVALKTTKVPLIDRETCQLLQDAAQSYRLKSLMMKPESNTTTIGMGQQSTRFTMQYPGNSDLHVADLMSYQPDLLGPIFDTLLQQKVYPLIRKAFLSPSTSSLSSSPPHDNTNNNIPRQLPLCVYDALIVRYDGDKAIQENRSMGASLPLVRC